MTISLSISFLLKFILIFLILLSLNIIYLTYKKHKDNKGQHIKNQYILENELAWFHYFRDGATVPDKLIPRNRYEVEAIEEIFFIYLHNLKSPTVVEKISQFSNEHLYDYFKKNLQSKRWSSRMNAMQRIVDFKIDRLVDDCLRLDQAKLSSEEEFLILKVMANLREDDFIKQLLNTQKVFSEYEYKRVFMDLDDDNFEELVVDLHLLPAIAQYAVIDLIGMKRNVDWIVFLNKFLKSEDQELRIRSLKAIYEIGVVEDLAPYAPFSESSIWEERLMFTKLLTYIPSQSALPYLNRLIKDESWSVRSQAARVIVNYKDGQAILRNIVETKRDKFAVDMARSFLKEGDS